MNKLKVNATLSIAALIFVTACSSSTPRGNVPASATMEPSPKYARTMRYVRSDVDYRKYTTFIVDPVDIYTGSDADFGDASEQDKQDMANYTYSTFRKVLGEKYQLVNAPAQNAARIHVTLVGLEATHPVLSTVTHLAPAGLALNMVRGVTGGQGSFMGSVTLEVDIYDSMTSDLIASVVTNQQANALDLTSVPSQYGAARTGVNEGAEKLLESINNIQEGKGIPTTD